MRYYPDPLDPTKRYPFYEREEIEQIVTGEMRKVGMDPKCAQDFCPELFLMECFGCGVDYWDLPEDVHGEAIFSGKGLVSVRVNRVLDSPRPGAELLLKSTIAHEVAGHGLLHESVIVPELAAGDASRLFRQRCFVPDICETPAKVGPGMSFTRRRALEFQANLAMGIFRMPRQAILREMQQADTDRIPTVIRQDGFTFWVDILRQTFGTSKAMTIYRLKEIFPALADLINAGSDDAHVATKPTASESSPVPPLLPFPRSNGTVSHPQVRHGNFIGQLPTPVRLGIPGN